MDPPAELAGKINVIPEMGDVLALATMYVGGEVCSEDPEVMKKVRDALLAAKPKWLSMDYSTIEKMTNNDYAATVDWNGSAMRARLGNPDVPYGYPKEGYGLWMDNVVLLKDAKNGENAYPVSYTHLDVYKRQILVLVDAPNSCDKFIPAIILNPPSCNLMYGLTVNRLFETLVLKSFVLPNSADAAKPKLKLLILLFK